MIVFITGISSGFGLETARELSRQGHTVYGTVRRQVNPLPGVNYLHADVRDAESIKSAVNEVINKEGRIDILINNAGTGIGGPLELATEEEVRLQMDTNFTGVVNCVNAVLPQMRAQKGGTIITISSIGGLIGLPFQGYYSASKFAVEGYSESLRLEVGPFGIKVVVIRPGDFSTGFTSSRKKTPANVAADIYPAYLSAIAKVESDEGSGLKPAILAQKICRIVKKKRPRNEYVVASFEQKLSLLLKSILPSEWFARILGSYYKL